MEYLFRISEQPLTFPRHLGPDAQKDLALTSIWIRYFFKNSGFRK